MKDIQQLAFSEKVKIINSYVPEKTKLYIEQNLIEAIKSFCNKPTCAVRIAGNLSEEFQVDVGVRQGCILSPLLFITFMDSVAKACSKMKKMNVGMWKLKPVNLTTLSFADDLVLFGKSEDDLQYNINILNNELSKRGMKINAKKTKTMKQEIDLK